MQKIIRRRHPGGIPDILNGLSGTAIHPVLARVYCSRGIVDPLELELQTAQLLPPAQLLNADRAAILLADHLATDSRIVIIGDFDADGATSTALAVTALRAFGATQVRYLVPNRFEFGYGMTPEIVAVALQDKPDLIVTVDNGISSNEGVAAAKAAGVATLITDHHLAGDDIPDADVIVNPNQPGCDFKSKNLAGVGVIFYVMLALRAELRRRGWFAGSTGIAEPNLAEFLDLVALGTVADVVPLDRNNRILVAQGLARIRSGKARPGVAAILEVASKNYRKVVASDLGFAVGPRLNAAGRLDDMSVGIECLMSTQAAYASALATQLHQLNLDRRLIEEGMQRDALKALKKLDLEENIESPVALTLYEASWHQGVIGILASRVKDRMHRPTIVFADGDSGQIKGSARSIPGVHIRDILAAIATRHPGLILKFGGHAMAAGLTLMHETFEQFSQAFIDEVSRHVDDVNLQAVIESDGELDAAELELGLATELRFAGPWGQHFAEPIFDGRFKLIQQRLVGQKHLKLVLGYEGSTRLLDAIAFNVDLAVWPHETAEMVDLAYRLDVNEFRGNTTLQLMVEQISVADTG
ncbi:MAG: single-stranded-DNA-specific exonuclease [Halioglobus sp.]